MLSLANLIELCRVLRHNLSAGVAVQKVIRQQAERGAAAVRPIAGRLRDAIDQGNNLSDALEPVAAEFPPLFLALVKVGEETGQLPEVFGELEQYYALEQKLRRQFWKQSLGPIIQLIAAFLLIAGLIFILGMIARARGNRPMSIFGLSGAGGALTFLVCSFGALGLCWAVYHVFTRYLKQQAVVHEALLRTPALGPCLEAVALARFAMALRLTLDSGTSITRALKLSLRATGNGAYAGRADAVVESLKRGNSLTEALTKARIFPADFLNLVAVAEEGGRVPEMMRHQADYYHEEASRRLTTLTRLAALLIWLIYAAFMIWAIFQIASVYLGALGA